MSDTMELSHSISIPSYDARSVIYNKLHICLYEGMFPTIVKRNISITFVDRPSSHKINVSGAVRRCRCRLSSRHSFAYSTIFEGWRYGVRYTKLSCVSPSSRVCAKLHCAIGKMKKSNIYIHMSTYTSFSFLTSSYNDDAVTHIRIRNARTWKGTKRHPRFIEHDCVREAQFAVRDTTEF